MKRCPATYALVVFLALGCGPREQPDNAPLFGGDWFGWANYVYRQNGLVLGTDRQFVGQKIVVGAKNKLNLYFFCNGADPGPTADVTSATECSIAPYECSTDPRVACPSTASYESGTGRLNGQTLTLAFHGNLTQFAREGCAAFTVQFDVSAAMTHTVPGTVVEVPQALKAEKDGFGRYALTWTVNDPVLLVEAQARIGSGDWQDTPFYFSGKGLVNLDLSSVPERIPVAFRVRTRAGDTVSDWSAEAPSDTGFAAPELLDADESSGVIQLRWQARQDVVSMVIERSESYEVPVWAPLVVLTPPGSSYDDVSAVENHRYAYRFHWLDATTDSFRVDLSPSALPLRAPVGLTAVASPGRVDLSWTNRSQLATEVVVLREGELTAFPLGGGEIAHLPASASTYSDQGLPLGIFTYSVEARIPGSMTSDAAAVALAATPPPASSGTWSVSFVDLPGIPQAALDTDGGVLSDNGSIVASDSPAWLPYAPDGGSPAGYPWFTLDGSLRPHLVYLRSTGQGPIASAVMHDWFDGTAWQSEEMARLDALSYAYALDPAGHPAVLVTPDGAGAAFRLVRWSGSAYVSESPGMPLSAVSSLAGMLIAVSPEGVIHVLAQDRTGTPPVHAWRGTSWTSEPVPLAGSTLLSKVTASTGDILSLTTQDGVTGNIEVLERGSSGWGTPVDIGISPGIGDVLNPRMATAADGSGPVLAVNLGLLGIHIARRSDGWTPQVLTGPATLLGFGYDGASHLYVIVEVESLSTGGLRAAVFREQ